LAVRWETETGEKRLAASDCAAIYGLHPYKTISDLTAELLAPSPPKPQPPTQAMERGNRLEQPLRSWASDMYGMRILEPGLLYLYDQEAAHLIATLDGRSEDLSIHEFKTTTNEWTGTLPPHWFYQGVQQAICANEKLVHWWVFDKTQTLHHYIQEVDWETKRNHIEAAKEFLISINRGELPGGVQFGYDHMNKIYPEAHEESVELGETIFELLDLLDKAKAHKNHWEQEEDHVKALIAERLGGASVGTVDGNTVVTWKQQTRSSVDTKSLALAHPDLVKRFEKNSTFRVLRINKKGK
jgi:predicted phage-related endonuclease